MATGTFINVRPYQTRVACVERGCLKQIFYYRKAQPSLVGALYKGRILRVIKGLNFAFIDLGLEKPGFLYGRDVIEKNQDITKIVSPGQDLLVQIKADPQRSKGVRVSMEIGLAGLYLVYLPEQTTKSTVSRQVESLEEKERLSNIVKGFKEKGSLIVRTFAQGKTEEELHKDLKQLQKKWREIQTQFKNQSQLGLLQEGEDHLLACLRDSLGFFADRFVIDEKTAFYKVKKWMQAFHPDLIKKVEYYKGQETLFEKFKLESQVYNAQQKKVMLKSGGFLIFEELEAFSVIDVNSGRFLGKKNLSKNLLNLNLEAARMIADQIQLRHLGGIILVDFVDMLNDADKQKVVFCLEEGLKKDKSYPRVFPMGELGMVQITRKRSKNSLFHFMTEVCPLCNGQGRKNNLPTIVGELFLKTENFASPGGFRFLRKKQKFQISCHPKIKKYIEDQEQETLDFFNKTLSLSLELKQDHRLNFSNFRIEKL